MAITLASLRTSDTIEPPRIVLYGVNGIGKTTFAAGAPSPVLIPTEDGLGKIKGLTYFPKATSYNDVLEMLQALITTEHTFKTVIIDSFDWLEKLIFEHVARLEGKNHISDIGYNKGYESAQRFWYEVIRLLDRLRNEKSMAVILIGHVLVKQFNAPDTENYDRYRFDIHDKGASVLRDWCDVILFANYKTYIKSQDAGFNKKEHKGVGSAERVLYTEERPAFWAKNRYGLPFEIPTPDAATSFQQFSNAMSAALAPTEPQSQGEQVVTA